MFSDSVVFLLVKHYVIKIRDKLGIFAFCTDNTCKGKIGGKHYVNLEKRKFGSSCSAFLDKLRKEGFLCEQIVLSLQICLY